MLEKDITIQLIGVVVNLLKENNGYLSFDDYDKLMFEKIYLWPLYLGCPGINLGSRVFKQNRDKIIVFIACKKGFVEQVENGYKLCLKKLTY